MASPTFERINHRLSPASLNAYFRCPRKFQWRYIRKVKTPYVFKPHLAFGGATHKAIARCLGDQLDKQPQQTFESYATTYVGRAISRTMAGPRCARSTFRRLWNTWIAGWGPYPRAIASIASNGNTGIGLPCPILTTPFFSRQKSIW